MTQIGEIIGRRQSGRTIRQLEALPDGACYMVHSGKMAAYCRLLLRAIGRRPDCVRFVTPENFRSFEGIRPTGYAVDHASHQGASPVIEGIVVVLFGTVMMFAEPAHDLFSPRRLPRASAIGRILIAVFPIVPADPDLEQLLDSID